MIVPANTLHGFAVVLDFAVDTYFWIVIGSAIVSWVSADPWNPIVRFLRRATDPVYLRLRRAFPFLSAGGIDFAPLAVIALLYFLESAVVRSLYEYAYLLKMR